MSNTLNLNPGWAGEGWVDALEGLVLYQLNVVDCTYSLYPPLLLLLPYILFVSGDGEVSGEAQVKLGTFPQ